MGVVASPSIPHGIHYSRSYSSTRLLSLSGGWLCHFCPHCTARIVDFHPQLFIHATVHQYIYISLRNHLYSGQFVIHRWAYSSEFVGCEPGTHERVGFGVFCQLSSCHCRRHRPYCKQCSIHPHSTFFHPRFISRICPHTFIRWRVTKIDGPSLVLFFAYLILIEFGRLKFLCARNYAGYWAEKG